MKRYIAIVTTVLMLSGCFQRSSENYSPVGQAALDAVGADEDAALARVEAMILAKGLKREPGIVIAQVGGPSKRRWYQDAHGTHASLEVSAQGCISFLTYVRTGSNELASARSLWYEVVGSLNEDLAWAVKRDQICGPAA